MTAVQRGFPNSRRTQSPRNYYYYYYRLSSAVMSAVAAAMC